jgi:hypothetical protein
VQVGKVTNPGMLRISAFLKEPVVLGCSTQSGYKSTKQSSWSHCMGHCTVEQGLAESSWPIGPSPN